MRAERAWPIVDLVGSDTSQSVVVATLMPPGIGGSGSGGGGYRTTFELPSVTTSVGDTATSDLHRSMPAAAQRMPVSYSTVSSIGESASTAKDSGSGVPISPSTGCAMRT